MIVKELLTLRPYLSKLKSIKIKDVDIFLERCKDTQGSEFMRKYLEINVTQEQWEGALAVIRDIFK